jgi:hypothetical protein
MFTADYPPDQDILSKLSGLIPTSSEHKFLEFIIN